MQHVFALVCVHALALGLAVQGVMAGPQDGLRLVGKEYHAKEILNVFEGFAVSLGQSPDTDTTDWYVVQPGSGQMERFDTLEEMTTLFHSLPANRTGRGIFLIGNPTHLEDPEASKAQMSDHMKTLVANPAWVAARKKNVQALMAACEKEKIDLWINVNLGGKNLRFRKLTK